MPFAAAALTRVTLFAFAARPPAVQMRPVSLRAHRPGADVAGVSRSEQSRRRRGRFRWRAAPTWLEIWRPYLQSISISVYIDLDVDRDIDIDMEMDIDIDI